MAKRRGFLLLLLVAASLGSLLAILQPWVSFSLKSAEQAATSNSGLVMSGNELSPLVLALNLAFLAVVAVLTISGKTVRTLLFSGLIALTVAAFVSVVIVIQSPLVAAQARLTSLTGLTGLDSLSDEVESLALTAWPFIALVCIGLVAIVAVLGLSSHASWTASGQRYVRNRVVTRADSKPDRIDDWDDLSHGTDPTV